MSAAITAAAVIGGATIYSAHKAGKAADKAMAQADAASQLQFEISQQQLDLANEQWSLYKKEIFPHEQKQMELGADMQQLNFDVFEQYYKPLQEQFATEAMEGVEAQPERAAREARLSVDKAFEGEEGMRQRNLERRGVRPGADSAYESGISDTGLNRAAAKGFAVNRAIEGERDRVEDTNFNRKAIALGRTPGVSGGAAGINSAAATAGMAAAGNTAYGAGSQSARMGGIYGDATAGLVSGGVQLGMQAYDTFNKYAANQSATNFGFTPGGGADYASSGGYGTVPGSQQTQMLADQNMGFAEGGPVNAPPMLSRGYAGGGEVNGPPGYDQVPAYIEAPDGTKQPTKLMDNEYVIPTDVVEIVGTGALDDIIEKARQRKEKAAQPQHALSRRMH